MTIQSAGPTNAPIIDPNFLTHPFDRRFIIEGTREAVRIFSAPVYAADTIQKLGPKRNSDEAIWVRRLFRVLSLRVTDSPSGIR